MKIISENTLKQFIALLKLNFDNKVDKVSGKGLSTNDYTKKEKDKLSNIEENANNYALPVATELELGGIKSGEDITIDENGTVSVNDNSHKHIIDNVDGLRAALDEKAPTLCQTDNLGDAVVTRAKLSNDALYSPWVNLESNTEYFITANDLGKTIITGGSPTELVTVTMTKEVASALPFGAEIAIAWVNGATGLQIVFADDIKSAMVGDNGSVAGRTYQIPERYGMCAIKKFGIADPTYWLVTGNVEVVS